MLKLALKISFTVLALWIVLIRVDVLTLWGQIKAVPPFALLLAWLSLVLSQVVSALRMQYYFARAGFALRTYFCVAIYFSGALVNLVLPGGISGDGYKALFLKKHKEIPAWKALRLILSERANGLFFLLLLAIIFLGVSGELPKKISDANILLLVAALVLVAGYIFFARIVLKENLNALPGACKYSLISQTLVAFCAYMIFSALGLQNLMASYLAIFMISNVIAILPVSIGGAGLREIVFYYGALWFGLSVEQAVAGSLTFFGLHVLTSLTGLLFIHRLKDLAAE